MPTFKHDLFLHGLPQNLTVDFDWGTLHEQIVLELRSRLRRFDFGKQTESLVRPLDRWLKTHSNQVDLSHRLKLQAVSLISEFWDALGRQKEVTRCLQPTATRLLKGELPWSRPRSDEHRRLYRQQLWCLLAWAYNRYEASSPVEAAATLRTIQHVLDEYLIDAGFPCYGTQYHLWHLTGLYRRDRGELEQASAAFARSLRFARLRRDQKVKKYVLLRDQERVEREEEYFRISEARTLALGMGEVEFLRGAFHRAEALFAAADSLALGGGFPRWRLLTELYRIGCEVWTVNLLDKSSLEQLRVLSDRLQKTLVGLANIQVHHDYVELAKAFDLLLRIRTSQVEAIANRPKEFPFAIEQKGKFDEMLGFFIPTHLALPLRSSDKAQSRMPAGTSRVGPVKRLIQRVCVEGYVRLRHPLASRAIEELIQRHHQYDLFTMELTLLKAEHYVILGKRALALGVLSTCKRSQSLMSRRHDLWQRILTVRLSGIDDDLIGRPETLDLIDDGYLRSLFTSAICVSVRRNPFPYQLSGNLQRLDVGLNVRHLHRDLVRAAMIATSDLRAEDLFRMSGRKVGWFRKLFKEYADEEWAIAGLAKIEHSGFKTPRTRPKLRAPKVHN